ncbi:MAG: zf-HC2 domain-containing protein [Rhodocyclaceae bacterium]|nr:zf-HC2 domain-containing protein [Rhodocyclaceae bacterium]
MSQQMEQPLIWYQRLGLRAHLLMCAGCRRAEKQFRFLRSAARQIGGLDK